jgi:hypothetical protein
MASSITCRAPSAFTGCSQAHGQAAGHCLPAGHSPAVSQKSHRGELTQEIAFKLVPLQVLYALDSYADRQTVRHVDNDYPPTSHDLDFKFASLKFAWCKHCKVVDCDCCQPLEPEYQSMTYCDIIIVLLVRVVVPVPVTLSQRASEI